jgi:hypothetical protein
MKMAVECCSNGTVHCQYAVLKKFETVWQPIPKASYTIVTNHIVA